MSILNLQMIIRVLVAIFLFICVALLGVWIGDTEVPYQPHSGTIRPTTAEPASWITVTYYGKRSRNCDGTVYRQLIEKPSSKVHSYDPVPSIAKEQEKNPNQEIIREVKLPAEMKPPEGESTLDVQYRVITCYYCNPLQRVMWPICVRAPELQFSITNPKLSGLDNGNF